MVHTTYPILRGRIKGTKRMICSIIICIVTISYCFVFFKIKCPGKIPNIQGIWEICPGNQWFQVGKSDCRCCWQCISRNSVVVSTACARSRGPTRGCRARLRGGATRARARRHCIIIVRRDTWYVANADNVHLTRYYAPFFAHYVRLCDYAHRLLRIVRA